MIFFLKSLIWHLGKIQPFEFSEDPREVSYRDEKITPFLLVNVLMQEHAYVFSLLSTICIFAEEIKYRL